MAAQSETIRIQEATMHEQRALIGKQQDGAASYTIADTFAEEKHVCR